MTAAFHRRDRTDPSGILTRYAGEITVTLTLRPSKRIETTPGPVLLVVIDGVGLGRLDEYDAVHVARTPTLDRLTTTGAYRALKAHGTAVGLPSDDDMGNSEVGHNALGAGRVVDQGAKLVNRAIEAGAIFESDPWRTVVRRAERGGALHLVGLLSDGNVHSHERHLHALVDRAASDGVARVFVHALLDGRDVPETSALEYVDRLTAVLARHDGGERRYRIASGGGRMITTMDRYEADWEIVKRGWEAHVHGNARRFRSPREAIETFRGEDPGVIDQFLPPFVVEEDGEPVGRMRDGDSVVFFNFRGDRAIEISRAFEAGSGPFDKFDRGEVPDVYFAGMTLYDGDLGVPRHYLVAPPAIDRTFGEYLARAGVTQFALSETQKYGHVTYFWNGNRSGKFDDATETYEEIPSDRVPFEQRPWMKAAEITDRVVEILTEGKHRFCRINFANGDMVGHSGQLEPTVVAVEAVDLCLARIVKAIDRVDGTLVVLADHGNADDMVERKKDGTPKLGDDGAPRRRTSHSLNPVPFVIHRPGRDPLALRDDLADAGLANVAATVLELLGFEPPDGYAPSLLV